LKAAPGAGAAFFIVNDVSNTLQRTDEAQKRALKLVSD
jgi:hypothetical protein